MCPLALSQHTLVDYGLVEVGFRQQTKQGAGVAVPMLRMSGTRWLILTPAMTASEEEGWGKPPSNTPTSVVVPPMSTTIPSATHAT